MNDRKAYLLAPLGAVAGGFVPAYAVSAGTAALGPEQNAAPGLPGFAAAALVVWVGAPLGVWAALTLGKQPHAGRTALLTVAVLILAWIALTPVMVLTPLGLSDALLTILSPATAVLAPLAARRLATWRRLSRAPVRGRGR
jgi:cell division protein FtsW (lipid II flippase)